MDSASLNSFLPGRGGKAPALPKGLGKGEPEAAPLRAGDATSRPPTDPCAPHPVPGDLETKCAFKPAHPPALRRIHTQFLFLLDSFPSKAGLHRFAFWASAPGPGEARNTACGPSTWPSLYCVVTFNLTINTTAIASKAQVAAAADGTAGLRATAARPRRRPPGPPGSVHYLQLLVPFPTLSCKAACVQESSIVCLCKSFQ